MVNPSPWPYPQSLARVVSQQEGAATVGGFAPLVILVLVIVAVMVVLLFRRR